LIRGWVRHPQAGQLTESACYKVFPGRQAALAWRYRDPLAAEREDGTRGPPLVSRVLVGQSAVLTPEVAIAACRLGPFPALVGPAPGQVIADDRLPVVAAGQLTALAESRTAAYDAEAARQDGLRAVIAAALSDPCTPLSVDLAEVLSERPLADGVQGPLLWGLRQIAGPLFGSLGPDWSFSTFEPRLGDTDPGILPHIVFRVTDETAAAPARWRREVRVRPFAPGALDLARPYAEWIEFARALIDEYLKRPGAEFEKLIADRCGSEQSVPARLTRVRDELGGRRPAASHPLGHQPAEAAEEGGAEGRELPWPGDQGEPAGSAEAAYRLGARPSGPAPAERSAPAPLDQRYCLQADQDEFTGSPAARLPGVRPAAVSDLLRRLEVTVDIQVFQEVLREIDLARGVAEQADRARSRKIVSNIHWYDNICQRFTHELDIGELAGIFQVIVIPDLAEQEVAEVIARWAMDAPPTVIGGLLVAARQSGNVAWQAMMRILQPILAYRWTVESDLRSLWDPSLAPGTKGEIPKGRRGLRLKRS
jgi:hypothetical protein